MNSVAYRTNYTITLLRILACLLIVHNHLSGFMLDGLFNKWNWANIGVQIFFFMSGFLYGGKLIADKREWILKQTKKIIKPYYLSLIILIPLVFILDRGTLDILNITSALLCLQGFGPQIEGLGQHWFVSYILVCYVLTAFMLNRLKNVNLGGGKFWLAFVLIAIVFQLITVPLAILIKFKSAYIMTFVIGYCYKIRFSGNSNTSEKRIWERVVIICALIGIVVRYFLEGLELNGIYEKLSDLVIQYIKLFWGCSIFVVFNKLVPYSCWEKVSDSCKKKLVVLAGCTYEIYLVHEFFVHEPYTSLFGDIENAFKILIVLTSIVAVTILLCLLEKLQAFLIKRRKK